MNYKDGQSRIDETARQSAEIEALRRMIELSAGTFSLSLAVCNSPSLREFVVNRLKTSHKGIVVVPIKRGTIDVFGFVSPGLFQNRPDALFVTELEHSIPSGDVGRPALRSLNASRELWERSCSFPVVFWLPEYAMRLLSIEAPDLWRYKSHRFEFVSEMATMAAGLQDHRSGNIYAAAALLEDEKHFRIAELEQRISEVGSQPSEGIVPHLVTWMNELAFLHSRLGQIGQAEHVLKNALAIDEKLGRLEGMATNYGNLGLIYQMRGDLDQAEAMRMKALAIDEKLGRLEGMAADYGNLGVIHEARGDLDQAEEMHKKALAIDEKLGRLEGMATNYGNLGNIYQARGDLDRAEEMQRKAMAIDEKLGRLEGMAANYGNLGIIYRMRGDLDQAEQMYKKSLEISERLGLLQLTANQSGNLGIIHWHRGNMDKARELSTKARDIWRKIGNEKEAAKYQNWLDNLDGM